MKISEYKTLNKAEKRHKYGAQKIIVDGIQFDSKAEAARYVELSFMERAGEIFELTTQCPFLYTDNGRKIFKWVADFRYFDGRKYVMEDVKGAETAVFRLKRKLIESRFGFQIQVVKMDSGRVNNALRLAGQRVESLA